jgi:hypothetical protein
VLRHSTKSSAGYRGLLALGFASPWLAAKAALAIAVYSPSASPLHGSQRLLFYFSFGLLFSVVLVREYRFPEVFCVALLPYFLLMMPSRYNVLIYLANSVYLFTLTFLCLLSAIVFTLLPIENAMHYYGLPAPDNYIALAFCALPLIALFVHMLHKGCKSKEGIEKAYVKDSQKINIETGEYYMNQGINIFNGVTRVRMKDMWLNKLMERHIAATYRVLMIASGVGPVIPILILRNSGQQPLNYYLLFSTSYLAWLCAYTLPIAIHMTRTVLYPEYFIRNMLSAAKSLIMIGIQMDFDNILKWQIAIINRCAFHPVQARK